MRKRLLTLFLSVVVCICLLTGVAVGETERGDLAERFSDVSRIEYNGTVYSLRNRITTVLFMGIALDEEIGAKVSDLTALVVLDDNEKKITPIRLSCRCARYTRWARIVKRAASSWSLRRTPCWARS